jgi:hypothetical protein
MDPSAEDKNAWQLPWKNITSGRKKKMQNNNNTMVKER